MIPEEIWTVPNVEIPDTDNEVTDAIPPLTFVETPDDAIKVVVIPESLEPSP